MLVLATVPYLKLWFVRECGAVAMLGLSLMSTRMIRELYCTVDMIPPK